MGARPERMKVWRAEQAGLRQCMAASRGSVHLTGIGGVGMAGLALHLQARGFEVEGSDTQESRIVDGLRRHGIVVRVGHHARHVSEESGWLIRTPAVSDRNPEIVAARARGLPVYTRGQVLPVLLEDAFSVAVCGSHGKTTTSAMLVHLLQCAGRNPAFLVGGETDRSGTVAGVGDGDIIIAEADESDGTLALYEPEITVLTGIEYDHMENFSGPEAFTNCFRHVVSNTRRHLVYCADDTGARSVAGPGPEPVSFGLEAGADLRASGIHVDGRTAHFEVSHRETLLGTAHLPVPGEHNIRNALAALAVGFKLGLNFDSMRHAFETYLPVRRRFEWVRDDDVLTVVTDYAHHPSELKAAVAAARALRKQRLVVLFQPHRYSRTRALGPDFPPAFAGVDRLVLAPVYAASETPLSGGSSRDLLEYFHDQGMEEVILAANLEEARDIVWSLLRPGDMLLVAGAGDVDDVAHQAANWSE